MPRKEIDYSKTIIYKIVCNDLNIKDCYVGHTTDFTKRKYSHKANSLNESNKDAQMKVYQTIRACGGWENWSMIEIEKYPCCDSNEACKRERYWYEELSAQLNVKYPTRSSSEWAETNKDIIKEKKKQYHVENRETIIARVKKFNADHSEERREYLKTYRATHQQEYNEYREINKDKINEQRRKRRAEQKALLQQST
jgi:hypothetical protein